MPLHNEGDDSDTWRDDDSTISTDLDSQLGDLEWVSDSDYDIVSTLSGQNNDDETDSGDHVSDMTPEGSGSAVASVSDPEALEIEAEHEDMKGWQPEEQEADEVLSSTELPQVTRSSQSLNESTTTVTPPPTPISHQSIHSYIVQDYSKFSSDKPFNILYYGDKNIKPYIIRKIGESLMANVLKSSTDLTQSRFKDAGNDWTSGSINVVPISDFEAEYPRPLVELVEDSLVKLNVKQLDLIESSHRSEDRISFHLRIDGKIVPPCQHASGPKAWLATDRTCHWNDTLPTIIVYCEKLTERTTFSRSNFLSIEQFAEAHSVPVLPILKNLKEASFGDNSPRYDFVFHQNGPIRAPFVKPGSSKSFKAYKAIDREAFFTLDPSKFGASLTDIAITWGERRSVNKKNCVAKFLNYISNWNINFTESKTIFKISVILCLAFLTVIGMVGLRTGAKSHFESIDTHADRSSDLRTGFTTPPSLHQQPATLARALETVTVTEQLVVTSTETRTRTVTSTLPSAVVRNNSKISKNPALPVSTVTLHQITSSVFVPRVPLKPQKENVNYGYAFEFDEHHPRMYLETDHSVLLRLPRAYRESAHSRPPVKISVSRDGEPIRFDIREWLKNDLAFIYWPEKDANGVLTVRAWTEKTPLFSEEVIVDYGPIEGAFDARMREFWEKTNDLAWKELSKIQNIFGRSTNQLVREYERVAHSASVNYAAAENEIFKQFKNAQALHSDIVKEIEKRLGIASTRYEWPNFTAIMRERDWQYVLTTTAKIQKQIDEYVAMAQKEALSLTGIFTEKIVTPRREIGKIDKNGKSQWDQMHDTVEARKKGSHGCAGYGRCGRANRQWNGNEWGKKPMKRTSFNF